MNKPIVFLFSGQGSQYYGMGKELYFHNPIFRDWMTKLNNIVYQNNGISVIDEIYDEKKGPSDIFDQLLFTHPAIFMVEYSLAQVFIQNGFVPNYILGTSLGEFTAAAVSGSISVEESLLLIMKQVELVSTYCRQGRMMAIIYDTDLYHQSSLIYDNSELAAVNYASHFVISGYNEGLLNIENFLRAKNILFQILPISYGFHSKSVDLIEQRCKEFFANLSFKKPEIPIISCTIGDRLNSITPEHFWNIIRQPIHFQKTINKLENIDSYNYIDLGPYSTLVNFIKYNLTNNSKSKYFPIMTPFHQEIKNIKVIEDIFQKQLI